MISINLINWRSQRSLILNRRFAFLNAAAVAGWIVVAIIIYLLINLQISKANADVDYLEQQLKNLSGPLNEIKSLQAQKDILLSRRKIISILQESRPLVVRIFDNIARELPDGVVLSSMQRKDDEIVLNGTSDSNYSISVLMENIQRQSWVKSAKLGEIKGADSAKKNDTATASKTATSVAATPSGAINFSLTITTVNPEKDNKDSADTTGTANAAGTTNPSNATGTSSTPPGPNIPKGKAGGRKNAPT